MMMKTSRSESKFGLFLRVFTKKGNFIKFRYLFRMSKNKKRQIASKTKQLPRNDKGKCCLKFDTK